MGHRFAIIGCGRIAARHAAEIARVGELGAVCDIDTGRAASLAATFGGQTYASLSELLASDPAGIMVVCTPNGLHAAHCIEALGAGRHVLCEKPLAISVTDGQAMIRAARDAGKRLFVVKQNRFNPPVATVHSLLQSGALGQIDGFQINCFWHRPPSYFENSWHGTRELDGGTLFTQFSHFIDLLYWFLGEVRFVTGWRSNVQHQQNVETEDQGVASIVMKNGCVGSLHYTINAHEKNFEGSITLFGRRGTVKIGGPYLDKLEYFSVDGLSSPVLTASRPPNHYGDYSGSMGNHHLVYDEMIRALDGPGHAALEADEALKSVEIIEQIYAGSPLIACSP